MKKNKKLFSFYNIDVLHWTISYTDKDINTHRNISQGDTLTHTRGEWMDSTKLNYLCQFLILLQCVCMCVFVCELRRFLATIYSPPTPPPSLFNISKSLFLIIPHFKVLWARARQFSGQLRSIMKGSGVQTDSKFYQKFSLKQFNISAIYISITGNYDKNDS